MKKITRDCPNCPKISQSAPPPPKVNNLPLNLLQILPKLNLNGLLGGLFGNNAPSAPPKPAPKQKEEITDYEKIMYNQNIKNTQRAILRHNDILQNL